MKTGLFEDSDFEAGYGGGMAATGVMEGLGATGGAVGGTLLDATGGGAAVGVPVQLVAAAVAAAVAADAAFDVTAGILLMADAGSKASETKPSSAGKMQKEVERGQAPRDVKRVDNPHPGSNAEPHVHFCDGTACNRSGTTHDAHRGDPNPPKKTRQWLDSHGWTPPSKGD